MTYYHSQFILAMQIFSEIAEEIEKTQEYIFY